MQLQRTDPRGAKRIKPRIEELIKIPVHQVITNKAPATRFINGDRFDFVDEMLGDQFVLTIHVNGRPAVSYPIEEIEIAGRIKNAVPFEAQHFSRGKKTFGAWKSVTSPRRAQPNNKAPEIVAAGDSWLKLDKRFAHSPTHGDVP